MFAVGLFTFNAAIVTLLWIHIADKLIAGVCSFLLIMICGLTITSSLRILKTFQFKNETDYLNGVEYLKQKQLEENEHAQNNPLAVKETKRAAI